MLDVLYQRLKKKKKQLLKKCHSGLIFYLSSIKNGTFIDFASKLVDQIYQDTLRNKVSKQALDCLVHSRHLKLMRVWPLAGIGAQQIYKAAVLHL